MSSQKRTKFINLANLRKSVSFKPLVIGATGVLLGGCGMDSQEASIYVDATDCKNDNPTFSAQCESTYQQALNDAKDTAPKYATLEDCEYDFGSESCQQEQSASGGFFMPMMAGYMLGRLGSGRSNHMPLHTSSSKTSPLRGKWFTADGTNVGNFDSKNKKYSVRESFFNKRPTTTSTLKRGGFGNIARAKASRSVSSNRGWGG